LRYLGGLKVAKAEKRLWYHSIGSSKKQKNQLLSFMASRESAQMNKVLCSWYTAMCSKCKSVTGPMILEKAKHENS
jgi:hypothetical protein